MGKYFTIGEMVHSDTAERKGINNLCPKSCEDNLNALISHVLDPLREAYGKPIRVNSGYRSDALNRAVGGVATSYHTKGCAADIVGTPATKEENEKLFYLIQSLGLPFTELIDEHDFSWVHVSYMKGKLNRKIIHL